MRQKKIGLLCYDLSPASASIINDLYDELSSNFKIKAYPLFKSNDILVKCEYRPSKFKPKFIKIHGNVPEVQILNININIVKDIVDESDIIGLIGLQGISAFLTSIYAYIKKKPIFTIVQMMNYRHEGKRNIIIKIMKHIIFKIAKLHFAQSEPTINSLKKAYKEEDSKIIYVPWDGGANLFMKYVSEIKDKAKEKYKMRKNLGISESCIIILFVGSIYYLKGIDLLIKAVNEIKRKNPNNILLIAGKINRNDEYFKYLDDLIDSMNLRKNVRFLGELEWQELAKIYLTADIFVLPTRKDIWPKVITEAMCFGLPIITTEVCGCANILVKSNVNGFVVPKDDLNLIVNSILALNDIEIRKRYGENSINIIYEYLKDVRNKQSYKAGIERIINLS